MNIFSIFLNINFKIDYFGRSKLNIKVCLCGTYFILNDCLSTGC